MAKFSCVTSIMAYPNQNQIPECMVREIGGLSDQFSNVLLSASIPNNTITMPSLNSTLSAEAPEFVPRFVEYAQQSLPQQNSPLHDPILQQQQVVGVPNMGSPGVFPISSPQFKYVSHPVILQVNGIVVDLSMKPHKFDQIANQMTSILSWKVKEAGLMKEIVSVIFEQGVGEPNFRFNGGRLCQHLNKHVTLSYEGPSFKHFLLQRCQEEFNCKDYYLQTEPSRLCGFTLFLADIFTNLVTPAGQPLSKLREAICTMLMTLLADPRTENLKCIAQVLKGTGKVLDVGPGDDMEKVMCLLKDVTMKSKLEGHIQSMMLNVIELRAANWGQSADHQGGGGEHKSAPNSPLDVPPVGTVYYGPGGVIQRVEEEVEDSASDTDDSYYGLPPQSDVLEGEAAKAFEEFLLSQHNQ